MNAIELLRKIGVVNEIQEVKLFEVTYENALEESYKIVTELGEIDFRIIKLKNGPVSKLDYWNPDYKFNRSVHTLEDFIEEVNND